MNYEQALEYIHAINWTFCKPGLARIGELCEKLGHPERDLQYIHVAGTNGKGSFCKMLSSVLQEIEGIGKKKRMALLDKFGTIDKIMSASIDELCEVEGIGIELAKKIHAYFKEQI